MATAGLQRIHKDVDTHYDTIIGGLLEAVQATRELRCKTCGDRIETWDTGARTQAAKLLLEMGYGKARNNTDTPNTHAADDLSKAEDGQLEALVSQAS